MSALLPCCCGMLACMLRHSGGPCRVRACGGRTKDSFRWHGTPILACNWNKLPAFSASKNNQVGSGGCQ